jgi:hypothetical protein
MTLLNDILQSVIVCGVVAVMSGGGFSTKAPSRSPETLMDSVSGAHP